MDWEQLRLWRLARAGTLAGAARSLGWSTPRWRGACRRWKSAGQKPVRPGADGHQLTEAGRQLLPAIEAMTQAARQLEHAAAGRG
jgi:DNA-binding transcriptional LysR family regulator